MLLKSYGLYQDWLVDLLADLMSAEAGGNVWVMWGWVVERC